MEAASLLQAAQRSGDKEAITRLERQLKNMRSEERRLENAKLQAQKLRAAAAAVSEGGDERAQKLAPEASPAVQSHTGSSKQLVVLDWIKQLGSGLQALGSCFLQRKAR